MLTLRDAVPKSHQLAKAELATLRLRLLKLGARVTETVSRIRLAFARTRGAIDIIAAARGFQPVPRYLLDRDATAVFGPGTNVLYDRTSVLDLVEGRVRNK